MRNPVDDTIKNLLNDQLSQIEKYLDADFISFYGPIIK